MTGRCFRNSRKAACGRASLSVLAARMGVSPSGLGRPHGTPGLRSPWQWRWRTRCLERGKGLRRVRFLSARGGPRCVRMELTCVPRKWRGPLRRDRCTWSRSPPRVSRLLCSPADGRLGRGERWLGLGRPSAVRSLFPADRCPGEESLDHGRLFFNRLRNAHTVPHRACAGPRSRQARAGPCRPASAPALGVACLLTMAVLTGLR